MPGDHSTLVSRCSITTERNHLQAAHPACFIAQHQCRAEPSHTQLSSLALTTILTCSPMSETFKIYRIRIEQGNILQKEGVSHPAFAQGNYVFKKKWLTKNNKALLPSQYTAGVYICLPVSPLARQHFSLVLTLLFILS